MFLQPCDDQIAEITQIFKLLNPDFQNYIIAQMKNLLKMNHNYTSE